MHASTRMPKFNSELRGLTQSNKTCKKIHQGFFIYDYQKLLKTITTLAFEHLNLKSVLLHLCDQLEPIMSSTKPSFPKTATRSVLPSWEGKLPALKAIKSDSPCFITGVKGGNWFINSGYSATLQNFFQSQVIAGWSQQKLAFCS